MVVECLSNPTMSIQWRRIATHARTHVYIYMMLCSLLFDAPATRHVCFGHADHGRGRGSRGRGRESTVDGPSPCVECLLIVTPFLFSYVYLYDGSRIAPLGQHYIPTLNCSSVLVNIQYNSISFHSIAFNTTYVKAL